jgi:hypothetical protein
MAAGIAAAEAALEPAELAIADRVHTGVMPCEMGTSVTLASDPAAPGYFDMHGRNFRFRMVPVSTVSGAIRLEDRQAGAVWLQRLTEAFPKCVWINPEPVELWSYRQSVGLIQRLMKDRMFALTLPGLDAAMRALNS